ncbi:hypothetical protein VNI00_003610 [Paramarasmius palmivorus]|uniref:Zn(2)-C6 fungal-type domain-containing protein n=1 Tax=Paramarasmius palmivorus TaxID=297713 RepID=A0AAW0DNZ9_9AGAR
MVFERIPTPDFAKELPEISEDEVWKDGEPTTLEQLQLRNTIRKKNLEKEERRELRSLEINQKKSEHRRMENIRMAEEKKRAETARKEREERAAQRETRKKNLEQQAATKAASKSAPRAAEDGGDVEVVEPPQKKKRLTKTKPQEFVVPEEQEMQLLDHGHLLRLPEGSKSIEKLKKLDAYTPEQRVIYKEGHTDGLAEAQTTTKKRQNRQEKGKGKEKEPPSSEVYNPPCEHCAKTNKPCNKASSKSHACYQCNTSKIKCSLVYGEVEAIARLTDSIDRLAERIQQADDSLSDKFDRFYAWLQNAVDTFGVRDDETVSLLTRLLESRTTDIDGKAGEDGSSDGTDGENKDPEDDDNENSNDGSANGEDNDDDADAE